MAPQFLDLGRDLLRNHWGEGLGAYLVAPTRAGDENFRRWFGRYERLSVSPGQGEAMLDLNLDIDTTEVLKTIKVPTLVLHNARDAFIPVEFSRYIADRVPDAKLVEMDGDDHLFWFHNPDEVVGEIEHFLLGLREEDRPDRTLSTVVFTDIVDSTTQAATMGDARWRELLDAHDRLARNNVGRFRGRLVKMTGDGMLATFDGPARGVTCASRLRSDLLRHGLKIRAGVHTGEVEARNDDIGGVAVHIAARLLSLAAPGEVLASRTVKDLSVGRRHPVSGSRGAFTRRFARTVEALRGDDLSSRTPPAARITASDLSRAGRTHSSRRSRGLLGWRRGACPVL
ncbi:MAG: adenylate/guanylate cyclase domain-containing protein [Actinomycetota bacterium]|nr:adenylate/guanylate cyclase domain-containing protein [Actinomycetota bacterium]